MIKAKTIPGSTFWLVWAVALVPLIISSAAFFSGWRPAEQINRGELFPAGVRLEQLGLEQFLPEGAGRWQLILLTDKPCRDRCSDWQQLMPKLHASLGRERDRIQWRQTPAGVQQSGLLLVDPQGYMVTRYSLDLQPQGVLKDLKRLLKISKVG